MSPEVDINDNLEAMAQALYDYWFVQFDFPDENGKPYKSSGGKMVWNEQLKREIPEGWLPYSVRDIVTTSHKGITPSYCEKSEVLVLNQKCVRNGKASLDEARFHNQEAKRIAIEERALKPFDTLVNSTGAGTLGRVGLFVRSSHAFTVTDSHMVRLCAKRSVCLPTILYLLVYKYEPYLLASATGSTGQAELDKGILLENIKVALPSTDTQARFEKIARSCFVKIAVLTEENKTLTKQRDFLLPLLMNGQVRVRPQGELNYRLADD